MSEIVEQGDERDVAGNERLTALAGAVILVLAAVELLTVPALQALLSLHFFVGVLLLGPLAVKTASTGWRFACYYTWSPAYRRKARPSRCSESWRRCCSSQPYPSSAAGRARRGAEIPLIPLDATPGQWTVAQGLLAFVSN